MLTREDVERALPGNLKGAATQSLTDTLNTISNDPIAAEAIRDNFISYASVLKDGKFRTGDYLNAVAYVSYKLMGMTNQDAYAKTFPQRWASLKAKNTSPKDLSAYVAMYNKGQLVNLILEQTLVPIWVLNQHVYQKAINTQADLMQNAQSEMVRTTAANSILTHLAKPKEVASQVSISINEHSGMQELKDLMAQVARKQIETIEGGGATAKQVASQRIIDVTPNPVPEPSLVPAESETQENHAD